VGGTNPSWAPPSAPGPKEPTLRTLTVQRHEPDSTRLLFAQSDNGLVASETHYSGAVTTDRYGQLAEANGDLRATFSLLRTEDGGRESPIAGDSRPARNNPGQLAR
jgi:hypothetical protein